MNNYDKILDYAKENNGYITTKEAEHLAENYEFTKSDASTFVNISKEFILAL